MAEFFEAVRLDGDSVRRHVLASTGWGRVFQTRADELLAGPSEVEPEASKENRLSEGFRASHSAASSFVVAASYAALYDPALAELLFWAASQEYLRAGEPRFFGGVLAACTKDVELQARWLDLARQQSFPSRDRFYALFILTTMGRPGDVDRELIGRLAGDTYRWRGAYLTELFIPAAFFIDPLTPSLQGSRNSNDSTQVSSAIDRLVLAYIDQFEFVRAMPIRWVSLSSRFLPVSPEVLAMLLFAARYDPQILFRNGQAFPHLIDGMMRRIAQDWLDVPGRGAYFAGFPSIGLQDLARRRWGS